MGRTASVGDKHRAFIRGLFCLADMLIEFTAGYSCDSHDAPPFELTCSNVTTCGAIMQKISQGRSFIQILALRFNAELYPSSSPRRNLSATAGTFNSSITQLTILQLILVVLFPSSLFLTG